MAEIAQYLSTLPLRSLTLLLQLHRSRMQRDRSSMDRDLSRLDAPTLPMSPHRSRFDQLILAL